MAHHKSGNLKQSNKRHKSDTSGKRALKRSFGPGKVSRTQSKANTTRNVAKESRLNRINREKQIKQNKRAEIWLQKRIGVVDRPSKLIGIVPISKLADTLSALKDCLEGSDWQSSNTLPEDNALCTLSSTLTINCTYSKYKTNCTYIRAERELFSILEVCRVSDIIILVADVSNGPENIIDDESKYHLTAIKASGLLDSIVYVQGLKSMSANVNAVRDLKKIAQLQLQHAVKSDVRITDDVQPSLLIRLLCTATPKELSWRLCRSYFVSDCVTDIALQQSQSQSHECINRTGASTGNFEASTSASTSSYTLKLRGYLRGQPMRLNSLVHIGGLGTARLASIEESLSPFNQHRYHHNPRKHESHDGDFGANQNNGNFERIQSDINQQESLSLEAVVDTLAGDQTWPTEQEMQLVKTGNDAEEVDDDDGAGRNRRIIQKKLPDGMSSYQADWYIDEEGNWEEEEEEEEGDENNDEDANDSEDDNNENQNQSEDNDDDDDDEQDITGNPKSGSKKRISQSALIGFNDSKDNVMNDNFPTDPNEDDGDSSSIDMTDLHSLHNQSISGNNSISHKKQDQQEVTISIRQQKRVDYLRGETQFQDEIDTPTNMAAKDRFARYRALQSFRTSQWHPKENLPQEYARIFQFQNFETTQKKMLSESHAAIHRQNLSLLDARNKDKDKARDGSTTRRSTRSRATSQSVTTETMEVETEHDILDDDDEEDDEKAVDSDLMTLEAPPLGSVHQLGGPGSDCGSKRSLLVQRHGTTAGEDGDEAPFIASGRYVTLTLSDVSLTLTALAKLQQLQLPTDSTSNNASAATTTTTSHTQDLGRHFLSVFSLLPYENKLSVLHFNLTRYQHGVGGDGGLKLSDDESDIIQSKDELVFQAGFRTFTARPVFSENNLNCDKHKMERFLQYNQFVTASVFGPVTYLPCPLLVFKRVYHPPVLLTDSTKNAGGESSSSNGENTGNASTTTSHLELVATGSLASINPDRIVLKKVILTGLPVRVRKRFAVVKHMFYTPEDVRWFKPAELVTKHGLRGHIREPVGTHGLFKAIFSGPITQNDTVMLILYKRVYPKFPANGTVTIE